MLWKKILTKRYRLHYLKSHARKDLIMTLYSGILMKRQEYGPKISRHPQIMQIKREPPSSSSKQCLQDDSVSAPVSLL